MATPAELELKIKSLDWKSLRALWTAIQAGSTPGWERGKALEYLVIRAFEIDPDERAIVRYPYKVSLFDEQVEEIDGAVHLAELSCLVEAKDSDKNVAIPPIVKMRSQLLRRPAGTIGLIFSKKTFTKSAIYLAHFTMPQAVLLWSRYDLDVAMAEGKISQFLRLKHRVCCEDGIPDYDPARGEKHMKQVYVFVEGPTDAEFLQRVLPPELLKDAEIVNAGGSSGIPSLARSVLVRRKKPIAVLMDADSMDPEVIEERRDSTEELIRAADASVPVKVVAALPEIEAWLFAAPEAIARALGHPVPSEWLSLGKRDPKGVLQQLAAKNGAKWDSSRAISLLDARDIDRIRALPEVSELTTFLNRVQKSDKAA